MSSPQWPTARPIVTARLLLEPLRVQHAEELAGVLYDPALHEFIGGSPASVEQLRARFARQVVGSSPEHDEGWLNWVVRRRSTGEPVGTVQATVRRTQDVTWAEIAWVVATAFQGQGLATEAAGAMGGWLRSRGAMTLVARIHPDHAASAGVARRLGLVPTDDVVDGEIRWVTPDRR